MVSSARLQSRNYEVQSVELESICSRKDCLERQLVILSVTVFTKCLQMNYLERKTLYKVIALCAFFGMTEHLTPTKTSRSVRNTFSKHCTLS